VSGVVCVVCPFTGDEKLKNTHVDLALWVWGPTLLSTHAPLPSCNHSPPYFFFSSPPPFSPFPLFFSPLFLFVLFSFLYFFPDSPSFPPPYSFSFPYSFHFFLGVCVCVYLCMYVRAHLAISCVLVNANVKHIKANVRYVCDTKINKMKWMWIM